MVARTHKTLIWERTRQVQRLRHQLREYFPAAMEAFADLDAPDALELLAEGTGPGPGREADPRAGRPRRSSAPAAATSPPRRPRSWRRCAAPQLGQPPAVTAAYAVTARSLIAVITVP